MAPKALGGVEAGLERGGTGSEQEGLQVMLREARHGGCSRQRGQRDRQGAKGSVVRRRGGGGRGEARKGFEGRAGSGS